METLSAKLRDSLKGLNSRRVPYNLARVLSYGGLALIVALILFILAKENCRESIFAFLDQKLPVIHPFWALSIAGGILWIPLLIPYIKFSKTYDHFFNNNFLPLFAKEFDGFEYSQRGIERAEFEQSQIFDANQIDSYQSQQGFYSEKEKIKMAWVKTEIWIQQKSHKTSRPLFYGWFLQGVLEKELAPFLILPQKTIVSRLNKMTGLHSVKKTSQSPIKSRNPNFEKHFMCYGSPFPGLFEFTALFMEKYEALKKQMFLSVLGNKLFLALNWESKFKLPAKKMTLERASQWKKNLEFYISFIKSLRENLS